MQQQPPPPSSWVSTVYAANLAPTKLWFDYTSTNYQAWKEQVLCFIYSQGLHGFIDGTSAPPPETVTGPSADGGTTAVVLRNPYYELWIRTDMLLKGWILCSLNDDVVYSVVNLRTSRDVWLQLENRFNRVFNLVPLTGVSGPTVTTTNEQNTREKDLKEYLSLHRAAVQGNWEVAKRIFDDDPNAMTASISLIKATVLHTVVGTGKSIPFVEKLVAAMPQQSLSAFDDIGSTALTVAAAVGNLAAASILVNRMPVLVYVPNSFGNFPIQIAALYAQRDMLKYLISVTKDDFGIINPYAGLPGVKLLVYAIDAEFFDIALYLVEKYPDLARLKLQDNSTALMKISSKKSVFCNTRRFNFWQRFISSRVSVKTMLRLQHTNGGDIESMDSKGQAEVASHAMEFCERLR
ncbi:hypothetical protein DH2020_014664 [Rehmannia glutinosa]|uniref:Retrotransposon Copia-like N-terminal domain-containing protein n=1 Tax=Rehmannia glutinosa TaxID=99300 RepID=A0ABR0X0K6_REHGL